MSRIFIIFWSLIVCSTNVFSYELGGVISGNTMAGVPLGRYPRTGEVDVEGICSSSGWHCVNCTHAVTCVSLPTGWLKVPIGECPEGKTCNAHLQSCSDSNVPECMSGAREYQHSCEQVGIFPDAYNCRKFHLCSPPADMPDGLPAEHRSALCPRHFGYNPHTAQCEVKLTHGQCQDRPVPECTKLGQTDVIPSSPNHYFVCLMKNKTLQPQVFICPHGWFFWGGFCQPEPKPETVKETEEKNTFNSEERTTTKMENFFSTEKVTTYAADYFLADKFDLANYETTDDMGPTNNNEDFNGSYERGDFW